MLVSSSSLPSWHQNSCHESGLGTHQTSIVPCHLEIASSFSFNYLICLQPDLIGYRLKHHCHSRLSLPFHGKANDNCLH